jgi:hypothetical protein
MLRDVMLSVVMLSVVKLSVVMLSVVKMNLIRFFTSKTQHQIVRVNSTLKWPLLVERTRHLGGV